MIANNARGEVILEINDKPVILCLTIGGLAKIETAFGLRSFDEIDEKFKSLSANEILILLYILIEGGGNNILLESLKTAKIDVAQAIRAIVKCFSLNLEN
jgi:hypothetical protein